MPYTPELDPNDPTKLVYRRMYDPFHVKPETKPGPSYTNYKENKAKAEEEIKAAAKQALDQRQPGMTVVPEEGQNSYTMEQMRAMSNRITDEDDENDEEFQDAQGEEEDVAAAAGPFFQQGGEGFGDVMKGIANAALISGMGPSEEEKEGDEAPKPMEEDAAPAPVTVARPESTSVEVPTPGVVVIQDEKAEVKEETKERVEDKNLQAVNLQGDVPKVNPVYLQQARDAAKESTFRLSHRARSDGGVAGAFLSSGAPKQGSDMSRGGIGHRGAKF